MRIRRPFVRRLDKVAAELNPYLCLVAIELGLEVIKVALIKAGL